MSKLIDSADPRLHSQNIQGMLKGLADHLEFDIQMVDAPRFEALLETTREVLKGLYKAFEDFDKGHGKAWGGEGAERKPRAVHAEARSKPAR